MQFAGKFEYDINGEDDDERVSIKEQTLETANPVKQRRSLLEWQGIGIELRKLCSIQNSLKLIKAMKIMTISVFEMVR